LASGLLRATGRPVRTRFRYGSTLSALNLATQSNSPAHYAKGTPSGLSCDIALRPLVGGTVSGSISLPSPGFFSPFPHGTGALSVAREYLALESGLSGFPQGFTCPVVLGNRFQGVRAVFAYGAITRSGGTFQILQLTVGLVTPRRVRSSSDPAPQPPIGNACGLTPIEFGLFPVRSPLLGESRLLSFPRGTEMFQFPRFASTPYGFRSGYASITSRGFPHSGIRGSRPACGFPRLIAACHALRRFLAPRHPPSALSSLTTAFVVFGLRRRSGFSRISYSVVKELASVGRARRYRASHLVEMTGFEPVTPCLQSRRSPSELHPPPGWWA